MSLINMNPVAFIVHRETGMKFGLEAGVLVAHIQENIRIYQSGKSLDQIITNGFMLITKEEAMQSCFLDEDALRRAVDSIKTDGETNIFINNDGDASIWIPEDLREKDKPLPLIACEPEKIERRDSAGYIYLIRELNAGHVKIGRTTDPKQRHRTFSVKMPFKIDVLFSFKCKKHIQTEERLHEVFSDLRVDGEWFSLSDKHVKQIKDLEFLRSLGIDVISVGGML